MFMLRIQLCIALAVILVGDGKAVEVGNPSRTSIGSAARRALAARDYDPTVRNPDWLAEIFIGPTERKIMAGDRTIRNLERDYREAIKDDDPITGMNLIRTRFADERLQHAVIGGAAQVVILGAGYDSRAYRMKELLRDVKVFEVDYGPTQEYKKRRVQEIFGCFPPNLTYVSIDFTHQKLRDVLVAAGYRPDRVTFFIWEGVTQYIPEDAVRSTLDFVATQSAQGSSIVLDGKRKSFIDWVKANLASPENVPQALRSTLATQKRVTDFGEPWIFGFPDGRERDFFKSVGLDIRELLPQDGPEARTRYLTRRDGSVAFPVTAPGVTVDGVSPSPVGWVAEALVPRR
jgi:methyltransferase (TIGR00027 family)